MSNKPTIYGYCPAGCRYETIHKEDFIQAAAYIKQSIGNGICYLELGKQYKIFAENVVDVGFAFAIVYKFIENSEEKVHRFTIPNDDKYAKYVVFKLLEASLNLDATELTLVYEIAGVRYTETISGNNFILLDQENLIVTDAEKVYLYNDEANYVIENEGGSEVTDAVLFSQQDLTDEQQKIARNNISGQGQILRCARDYSSGALSCEKTDTDVILTISFPYAKFTNNTHIEMFPANAATEQWLMENLNSTILTINTEQSSFSFSAKAEPTADFSIYFTITEMVEG